MGRIKDAILRLVEDNFYAEHNRMPSAQEGRQYFDEKVHELAARGAEGMKDLAVTSTDQSVVEQPAAKNAPTLRAKHRKDYV